MNCFSGRRRFLESGTSVTPRFGPTVPVVPAAASVWHDPQPADPVNTALPAAGLVAELAPLEAPGPAFAAPDPSDPPPVGDDGAAPGTPAWLAEGGGVPTGG